MERSNHEDIVVALAEVRPAPRSEFAAELDQWAAAGFPPAAKRSKSPLAALTKRLQSLAPRRLALATTASVLVAIAVATAVIAGNGSSSRPVALDAAPRTPRHLFQFSESSPRPVRPAKGSSEAAGSEESSLSGLKSFDGNASYTPAHVRLAHRDIERSAEISLLAAPDDVSDDSAQVFSAVHDANGIVLHSTTSSGQHAGARFDLLIPSARLGDALAAFSAIDEVGSRHDATTDITAPTVTVTERLRDARAKIDGLLGRLSAAETEVESDAIESELRGERRNAARLRSHLDSLNRRTAFSRVSLKIETGSAETGVTLLALAVIAPIALIVLLAWLAQRLWLRTRRERALDA
jgi:hypothetical protein